MVAGRCSVGGPARRAARRADDPAGVGAGPRPAARRALADPGHLAAAGPGTASTAGRRRTARRRHPGRAARPWTRSDRGWVGCRTPRRSAGACAVAARRGVGRGPPGPPSGSSGPAPGRRRRAGRRRAPARPRPARRTGRGGAGAAAPAGRPRARPPPSTAAAPRQAACAIAARAITRSARMPSTSNAAQTAAIRRSSASGSTTDRSRACAAAIRRAVSASASAHAAANAGRVGLERQPPAHHLDPRVDVARGPHLDGQPEPVEQLRAQLALLRVHRADQQERRRVRHRHAVALDVRAPHRGGVEQQVDEVVVQQVDLVDVEHAAVRVGEQPGLVGAHALGQRALQVERPDQPVLGRADRQLDQPGRAGAPRPRRTRRPCGAVRAARVRGRPGRSRTGSRAPRPASGSSAASARTAVDFAVPFSPRTSTPPTPGMHRVEQQREPQVVVADDGGEREPDDVAVIRCDARRCGVITASLPDRRSPSAAPAGAP